MSLKLPDPGAFDRPLTVERIKASATADAAGIVSKADPANWETYLTTWAQVLTRGGREYWRSDRSEADAAMVLRIPYSSDAAAITPAMRCQLAGERLEILAAYEIDNARGIVQLECKRPAADV